MLKIKSFKKNKSNQIANQHDTQSIDAVIQPIRAEIEQNGDVAVIAYTKKFDRITLDPSELLVDAAQLDAALARCDRKTVAALETAALRIHAFHEKQYPQTLEYEDDAGVRLGSRWNALDAVGLYVPGGTASYPSTVLMCAIPAIIAGTKKIVMANPRNKGKQNPGVLYAAKKCGIKKIYSISGAQAIAALTYGTKKIIKVNKIVGPGNLYVTNAKKEIFGDAGIDMIAGPSEITVVGDKYSNPDWIASDLIAQAEHDTFSQSILVSKDKNLINKVKNSLSNQLKKLPRKMIATKSLRSNGILINVSSDQKLIKVINKIAPEHLELNLKNYKNIVNKIVNAGSIFLGKYSTEAFGDYLAGTNHVLPTSGSAKFSSGLSVYDFYKRISYINLSKKGVETLGPSVITLANFEGLAGHAKSVELRIRRK